MTLTAGGSLDKNVVFNVDLSAPPAQYINVTGGTLDLSTAVLTINVVNPQAGSFKIVNGSATYGAAPTLTGGGSYILSFHNGILTSFLPAPPPPPAPSPTLTPQQLAAQFGADPTVGQFFNPNNTGAALEIERALAEATPEQRVVMIEQLPDTSTQTQYVPQMLNTISTTLQQAPSFQNAAAPTFLSSNEEDAAAAGVSAGDLIKPHGVWISGSGFASYARQGVIKGYAGYKNKSHGSALGADLKLSDSWMGGAVVTRSGSIVNMCNYATGSKYTSDSTLATIYAMYLPNDRIFIRSSITYGTITNINNSQRIIGFTRNGAGGYTPVVRDAYGKYVSRLLSPDLTAGYRLSLSRSMSLIPTIGAQYVNILNGEYKETGADPWNMMVRQQPKAGVWYGVLGAELSSFVKVKETFVMPEIHATFKKALHGQNPLILSSFDGMAGVFVSKSKPSRKVSYILGGSVTMMGSQGLSVGLGYDASLSEKYVSHRGSVRLKLNF